MITPMTNYPFRPLDWAATPKDLTIAAGVDNRQLSVYTSETVQRFVYGTRFTTWDGRVFKYSKVGSLAITGNSTGVKACTCLIACRSANDLTNEALVATAVAGDMSMVLTTATAATLGNSYCEISTDRDGIVAENELVGAYICFIEGEYVQNRMIIGNSALANTGKAITIYFDAPLDYATTYGTTECMILANPYMNVARANNPWSSVLGVPCRAGPTAALQNIWIQTWGILRVSPITETQVAATRQFVFDDQGAIKTHLTDYAADSQQNAGFQIEYNQAEAAYSCAPFIMLQISI